jgi:hypothetical protein
VQPWMLPGAFSAIAEYDKRYGKIFVCGDYVDNRLLEIRLINSELPMCPHGSDFLALSN